MKTIAVNIFDWTLIGVGVFAAVVLIRLVYRYWDRIW